MAEARRAYESETDAGRKRVKGAMYAGALFNRATNIFTRLVDLQSTGVEISASNDLMRECGRCLEEALSLCRLVLHRSGEEGIDELWGEPFRAFCIPLEAFYASRYLKMAHAMRDIDAIADAMAATFAAPMFPGIEPMIRDFARAAREKVETLRTDPDIFDIWAELVTAGERLASRELGVDAFAALDCHLMADVSARISGDGYVYVGDTERVKHPRRTPAFTS